MTRNDSKPSGTDPRYDRRKYLKKYPAESADLCPECSHRWDSHCKVGHVSTCHAPGQGENACGCGMK